MKIKFVQHFNLPLKMLGKLMRKIFSRDKAKIKNTGNVLRAKKSSNKATVFPKENMSFVNNFNEQNPNCSASPISAIKNSIAHRIKNLLRRTSENITIIYFQAFT